MVMSVFVLVEFFDWFDVGCVSYICCVRIDEILYNVQYAIFKFAIYANESLEMPIRSIGILSI